MSELQTLLQEKAAQFGKALDQDDFATAANLLSDDCEYQLGDSLFVGPEAICGSYESNMREGRRKFDTLIWGDSWVEPISAHEFFVHYTDYLTHKRQKHVHVCKQILTLNSVGQIVRIEHVMNAEESAKLQAFKQRVGLE